MMACPAQDETQPSPPNNEKVPDQPSNDAGATDGSGSGADLDAGTSSSTPIDAGGGIAESLDAGGNPGASDGSSADAGNGEGGIDGGPTAQDGGTQGIDCGLVDGITYKWSSNTGSCGASYEVTLRSDGRVTHVNQDPYPPSGSDACVPFEGQYEVFASTTQQLIQEVCDDFVSHYSASGSCDAPAAQWEFFTGDTMVNQTENLNCGNTSMANSDEKLNSFLATLMAPNTCKTGCGTSGDCLADETCMGAVQSGATAFGHCIDLNESFDTACGATVLGLDCDCIEGGTPCGEGLTCIGDLMPDGFPGPICQPAWRANGFYSNDVLTIPGAGDADGISSEVVVCGLYTVPYGGILTLKLDHDNWSDLAVTLQRSGGDPVNVTLTQEGLASGIIVRPPTDDSVNGVWTLNVKNTVTGETGVLKGWSVYFESWPD